MADFQLKDFDDQLAEHVRAYARQRRSTETQWFESAARNELNSVRSNAPYRVQQTAGRDAIHNHKYVRHGDVNIGDISIANGWKFLVGKLLELPEGYMNGLATGLVLGVMLVIGWINLNDIF